MNIKFKSIARLSIRKVNGSNTSLNQNMSISIKSWGNGYINNKVPSQLT